ncbi:amino acid/polyamine/organocation transporter, APC superfamily, partial [Haematococcus lacustris]
MCGANALTSSSSVLCRAVYAFSRDGAMLGSAWWHRLSEGTQQPWSCVWLMACLALLAALPAIFNPQFATALSATSVVALSLSYLVPIALALWRGDAFLRGAFSLGSWSRPLARLSCAWISLMSVVFCLPMHYPITLLNANWTPLLLALLLAFAAIL